MGMIGNRERSSEPSENQRRKALKAKVREAGFEDGFWLGRPVADRYGDDPELRSLYLTGARLGKKERERDGEE